MRLMDVRLSYCKEDFEWDNVQRLTERDLSTGNISIMRKLASDSLAAASVPHPDINPGSVSGPKSDPEKSPQP
jgi:hypothetical protein